MSYRYMRAIIFFDLPSVTYEERKEYTRFRKFLINEGFIMMQESVYSKILLNSTNLNMLGQRIKKNKPKEGLVQLLNVTEKQYSSIEFIVGESNSDVINTTDRFIII